MKLLIDKDKEDTLSGTLAGVSFGKHPSDDSEEDTDDGFDYLVIKCERADRSYGRCDVNVTFIKKA